MRERRKEGHGGLVLDGEALFERTYIGGKCGGGGGGWLGGCQAGSGCEKSNTDELDDDSAVCAGEIRE